MSEFLLPDLGEGLTDAEVVTWLVAVGDTVAIDQPVVEVETAKASVEVPVPFAGRVMTLHAGPGERVLVGSPLISIEAVGASPAAAPTGAPAGASAAPESSEYSGNVLIGYGTSPSVRRARVRRNSSPASAVDAVEAGEPIASPVDAAPVNRGVISPVVRKLARDRGIDVATVTASDPSGVVRRCDIEAISTAAPAAHATGTGRRLPLTGLRGVAAERLSRSRREIPEATVWVDVDATGLLDARRALTTTESPVSILGLVARFCVAGLRTYPELNSRIEPDAVQLIDDINIGFAAQTERGLVVPVVHRAHELTTRQLSAAFAELTAAGRAGQLRPAQLSGGTFTVNNYGVFGVDGSAAIINHPEVAMLGLGRIMDRPWVVDGRLAVRKVTELTLAFDHRACDGGVAGGFLRYVADCLENPVTALADL